ncbi:MAG: DMT family transporter [Desulfobacterales bacterium]|nr:DMT family transporter [Desulfobacterales bacterium]
MIGAETLAIAYGVGSALTWGAADFSGGLATRKNAVLTVLLLSQVLGLALLSVLLVVFGETFPGPGAMVMGALAGLAGALGIAALYRGLATARMGLVAPLSAVVSAVVPMIYAMATVGLPGRLQLMGIALALASVWLLSASSDGGTATLADLKLPVLAGLGFGLFFIFIDSAGEKAILWPLIAARCASVLLIIPLVAVQKKQTPSPRLQLPFIALAGILDTAGNAFFVLATQVGRLDISAVLTSLYPAATVMLAWLVLKERINRRQGLGVAVAVSALVLIGI